MKSINVNISPANVLILADALNSRANQWLRVIEEKRGEVDQQTIGIWQRAADERHSIARALLAAAQRDSGNTGVPASLPEVSDL